MFTSILKAIAFISLCNLTVDVSAQVTDAELSNVTRELAKTKAENRTLQEVVNHVRREREKLEGRQREEVAQLRDTINKLAKNLDDSLAAGQQKDAAAAMERDRLSALNRHLRDHLLNNRYADPDQEADGKLVNVFDTSKTVEIDIGHADAAYVGLRFDVFAVDPDESPAQAEVSRLSRNRCLIELISIDAQHRSTAKILSGADTKALQVGSLVCSPVWKRGQRRNVVVLDNVITIAGTIKLAEQPLREAGFETRSLSADSSVADVINTDTQYVVFADIVSSVKEDDDSSPTNYGEALAKARELAIPIVDYQTLRRIFPMPDIELDVRLLNIDSTPKTIPNRVRRLPDRPTPEIETDDPFRAKN